MGVMVSMLRGVNIGGHHKVRMEALRDLYASLGYRGAVTFIQSGNVLFRTRERNQDSIAARISGAMEQAFGFRAEVILRTSRELRGVVARNPFRERPEVEPAKLAVLFLARVPGAEIRAGLEAIRAGSEVLHLRGRELFVWFPGGMGRSKVPALVQKTLQAPVTGRNWNTVCKLLELAEALEQATARTR